MIEPQPLSARRVIARAQPQPCCPEFQALLLSKRKLTHSIEYTAHRLPRPKGPVVYFVSSATMTHVKIGMAANFASRLKGIQTGNHYPLTLFAYWPGALSEEIAAHEHFEDLRGNGEWFIKSPALLRTIRVFQHALLERAGLKVVHESEVPKWEDEDV